MIELSNRLKVTTVVVSHDIKSALEVGTRIILLENGRVVFDGKPENFKNSTVPLAREFQLGL
jgi:phospholipid/cholesterol/gamma-HCH transport system ATP-binding protein